QDRRSQDGDPRDGHHRPVHGSDRGPAGAGRRRRGYRISDGDNPQINWFEIASVEPKRSWDFYRELFGWDIKESSGDGYVHGEVDTGQGIPGGIGTSVSGKPTSQVYAQVDDLQKYLERAGTLGGKTIVEPMPVDPET